MGSRGLSAFEMPLVLVAFAIIGVGGGVTVCIDAGGEAGGVICNELDV